MKLTQLAIATVFAASVVPFGAMADNTGQIKFEGTVVESPCNIEQAELNQTVPFGQLSRASLEAGNQAEKEFNINFTGCDFEKFGADSSKPVNKMQITFTGQNYADATNTLLATSTDNSNNLGISISGYEFGTAKDVFDIVKSGVDADNASALSFTAIAKQVKSGDPVKEGKFSAISNLRITYE